MMVAIGLSCWQQLTNGCLQPHAQGTLPPLAASLLLDQAAHAKRAFSSFYPVWFASHWCCTKRKREHL